MRIENGRGTTTFFAIAFAITWATQLPAALAMHGLLPGPVDRFLPFVGLGLFGPAVAAMVATRLEGGRVRALFRAFAVRTSPLWCAVALLAPGALLVVGMAARELISGVDAGPWLLPPTDPQRIVAVIVVPFAEEIGWRGFALPRLSSRHGPLVASVVLGAIWAVWHVPMLVLAEVPLRAMATMVPFFVAGSVFFTWVYERSGGSLLVAVLAHAGAHLNNSHLALPGNATPLVVHTIAFVALAIALVLGDRRVFSRSPDQRGADAPGAAS